jgi:hypothetical protein
MSVPNARHPAYDRVTLAPTVIARLGTKKKSSDNKEYPDEAETFILSRQDGATDEILEAYGGPEPRALKVMSPVPLPKPGEARDTDSLTLRISNEFWTWRGLRCQGTGGDASSPQFAEASELDFARTIADHERVKGAVEHLPNGRFRIPCLGLDCPQYYRTVAKEKGTDNRGKPKIVADLAPGHIPGAGCKLIGQVKLLLLDPRQGKGPSDILGIVQITTSSINSIRDLVSGFELIRGATRVDGEGGRTQLIPFTIIRKPTWTMKVARRAHFTLAVLPEGRAWQYYAAIPPGKIFLPDEAIQRLHEVREQQMALDAVSEVIQRPAQLDPHIPVDEAEKIAHGEPSSYATSYSFSSGMEMLGEETEGATAPENGTNGEDPGDRGLSAAEIAELKDLCGGREDPENDKSAALPGVMDRLRDMLRRAQNEGGLAAASKFDELTLDHLRWVRAHIEAPASQPGSEAALEDRLETTNGDPEGTS